MRAVGIAGAATALGLALALGGGGTARADAQADCARAINAYAAGWDGHDAAGFAALFTDDATLDLGLGVAKGRAAIAEMFARQNPRGSTRHLMTNVTITPTEPGAARGVSTLLLFAGPPGATEVSGFALVGEYRDRFQLGPQGCRFTERKLSVVYRRAPPAPAATAPPKG